MTAFVLAEVSCRGGEACQGPWWEPLIPAAILLIVVACLKAPRLIEKLEGRRLSRLTQADVDEAFAQAAARAAMDRAASAARSEDGSAAAGGSGIGLPGLLFVVFLVLKLTGVIDWSWWWVTAPLWVSAALFVVIFVVVGLVAVVVSAVRR